MRATFIKTLAEIAKTDGRVYLITADMGFGLVEPFSSAYPERFINVGVAEQNMIGIASGLALSGKIVFVYSITNFPTLRCLEQIRNCVCYHNLRVHVVAGGTGFAYGALGMSHHSCEDVAVMRALPNMSVVSPSLSEVESAVKAIYESNSPCYLRLGWANKDDDSKRVVMFKIGSADVLMRGSKICLISVGSMIPTTLQVAERIRKDGVTPLVLSMPTIKPIDTQAIISASQLAKRFYTIEEHNVVGGLGSAVAEVIADNNLDVRLRRFGVPDVYCTRTGDRDSLLKIFGLTVENITREIGNAI